MKAYDKLTGVDRYLAIYNRAKHIWQGQQLQAVMDKAWVKLMDPEYRYIDKPERA